ncbi:MAG: CoA-binding protein [Gemmatimonadaceae bacterium]|nr:CoA-binding protein [Gemmatimonadaceae bacterium]
MPDSPHRITTDEGITALLERVRTVAVLGIKTADSHAPAFYVPEYAQRAGLRIIPVPVYYPDATEILGERVFRSVSAIGERVDLVDVFRRGQDIPAHLDDLLAAKPGAVWFQLGIRNDLVAERLAEAGIDVVQDRCLKVELAKRGR